MSPKPEQTKFVAYLRVSTARQGRSGLGLEAQREAVKQLVSNRSGRIIAPEFVEVESGKRNDRPELAKALNRCRTTGATLAIAKLDRLGRNAAFLFTLRDSGVHFIAADLPDANTLTIGVMIAMAQYERELISKRTKDALAAAKARGQKLGGHREGSANIAKYRSLGVQAAQREADRALEPLADELRSMRAERLSLRVIAARLNDQEITTPRHGKNWTAMAVKRALDRLT
jgi:DNA invertase Pin-like site-specific DNA recombinase